MINDLFYNVNRTKKLEQSEKMVYNALNYVAHDGNMPQKISNISWFRDTLIVNLVFWSDPL